MDLPQQLKLPDSLPRGLRFDVPRVADPQFRATGGVIEIFDAIGPGAVELKDISAALDRQAGRPVTVKLNSPGGSYFEGIGIFNRLRQHGAPVKVEVLGIAASAASIIAMAGTEIAVARNAEIMLHKVWGATIGHEADHDAAADFLRRLDRTAAETYAARTGRDVEEVAELMAAETFLTAQQAVELGFADKLLDRDADAPKRPAENQTDAPAKVNSKGELAALLRRAGLSKVAAQRVAAGGYDALTSKKTPELSQLAARLRAAAASIQ